MGFPEMEMGMVKVKMKMRRVPMLMLLRWSNENFISFSVLFSFFSCGEIDMRVSRRRDRAVELISRPDRVGMIDRSIKHGVGVYPVSQEAVVSVLFPCVGDLGSPKCVLAIAL